MSGSWTSPASGPGSALSAARPPGRIALWFGIVAPPAAWFLHLAVSYSLVRWVCFSGAAWTLHLTTAVSMALAGGAGVVAWGSLRELGAAGNGGTTSGRGPGAVGDRGAVEEPPSRDPGDAGRAEGGPVDGMPPEAGRPAVGGRVAEGRDHARFLARWGLSFAVGFVVLIAFEGIPPFVLHACGS